MKKIITVLATALALTVFASCTYDSNYAVKDVPLPAGPTIFDEATIVMPYGAGEILEEDNVKVVKITADSWVFGQVKFAKPINVKDAKKAKVIAKVSEGYVPGDAFAINVYSKDSSKGTRWDSWSDAKFMKDLANGYKIYEIDLSGMTNKADDKSRNADAKLHPEAVTANVDYSSVASLIIDPRGAKGDVYIRDIIFDTDERF